MRIRVIAFGQRKRDIEPLGEKVQSYDTDEMAVGRKLKTNVKDQLAVYNYRKLSGSILDLVVGCFSALFFKHFHPSEALAITKCDI